MARVHLDYNASTPIDRAVAAAMRPYLEHLFGSPSSGHLGRVRTQDEIDAVADQLASILALPA